MERRTIGILRPRMAPLCRMHCATPAPFGTAQTHDGHHRSGSSTGTYRGHPSHYRAAQHHARRHRSQSAILHPTHRHSAHLSPRAIWVQRDGNDHAGNHRTTAQEQRRTGTAGVERHFANCRLGEICATRSGDDRTGTLSSSGRRLCAPNPTR